MARATTTTKPTVEPAWRGWLTRLLKYDIAVVVIIAVGLIAFTAALGVENNKLIPANPAPTAHYLAEPHNRLSFLSNWDGPIYMNIAKHGYTSVIQTNFFPLYPLLTRLVNTVIGSTLISGLLVAWACFIGALYFYLKIVRRLCGGIVTSEAVQALLLFMLFPTGIFLLATYTESLFAFLSLGAAYFALSRKVVPAAIFTALATATHANGVFVVILIGLLLLEEGERWYKAVLAAGFGCLGLLAYMTYLWHRFDKPLAFVSAQKNHSWVHFGPLHLLTQAATRNGIFIILLLAAVAYWWPRRKSFSVYSFLYVCIVFLGSKGLSGLGRYSLMAFPVELMLYDYFRNKRLGFSLVLAVSAIAWAYFALQYMAGYSGG